MSWVLSAPLTALALQAPVTTAELCALSTLGVVAEVTGHTPRWSAGPLGGIETLADLAVEAVLFGTPPGDDLVVITPGGRLGALIHTIEDAPVLLPDHRYVLLLAPRPQGDGWRVVGAAAGAMPLPHSQSIAQARALLEGCHAR